MAIKIKIVKSAHIISSHPLCLTTTNLVVTMANSSFYRQIELTTMRAQKLFQINNPYESTFLPAICKDWQFRGSGRLTRRTRPTDTTRKISYFSQIQVTQLDQTLLPKRAKSRVAASMIEAMSKL